MVYALRDAGIRLGNQEALDKSGVTTTGRIEGKSIRGSKSTTYLIQYTFQLNGTPYHHSSQVGPEDYKLAQPGQSVTITYLPDRPEISRAQQSIARSEAQNMQTIAYLGLVVVAAFPFVYKYSRRSQRRRIASL